MLEEPLSDGNFTFFLQTANIVCNVALLHSNQAQGSEEMSKPYIGYISLK